MTVISKIPATEPHSDDEYAPNVFPKEEKEWLFIKESLKTNFLFQDLSTNGEEENDYHHLSDIVKSFEKHVYKKGEFLCKQGDTENADYMYLIARGSCSISIDGKVLPEPYGTIGRGSFIGDLALLYETARAATVRTKTIVTVYRLHRKDFHHFMDHATASRDDSCNEDRNSSASSTSWAEEIKQQVSEIDSIIDRISGVKTKYDGEVLQQFKPSRAWLWTRWSGTIMQHAWKSAVGNMSISLFLMISIRLFHRRIFEDHISWPLGVFCRDMIGVAR